MAARASMRECSATLTRPDAEGRRLAYEECCLRRRPGFRERHGGLGTRCASGRFAWVFPVRHTRAETQSSSRQSGVAPASSAGCQSGSWKRTAS